MSRDVYPQAEELCKYCLQRWGCRNICSRCIVINCQYNQDGFCIDIKVLRVADKQTGCVWYGTSHRRYE